MAPRRRKPVKPAKPVKKQKPQQDEIADPWQRMLRALQAYKTLYDDTRVPPRWKMNPDLARWVQEQLARGKKMPADQARQLEKLGFWGDHEQPRRQKAPRAAAAKPVKPAKAKRSAAKPPAKAPDAETPSSPSMDSDWETWFERAASFKARHGHLNAERGTDLMDWLVAQRHLAASPGALAEGRVERLRELGAFEARPPPPPEEAMEETTPPAPVEVVSFPSPVGPLPAAAAEPEPEPTGNTGPDQT